MANEFDDIKAANTATQTALANIAADIIHLTDQITNPPVGGMTADQATELKTEAAALQAKAEALAAQTPDV